MKELIRKILMFKYGAWFYGVSILLAISFTLVFPRIKRAQRMIKQWPGDSTVDKVKHAVEIAWHIVLVLITGLIDVLTNILATLKFGELPKELFLTQRIQKMFNDWGYWERRLSKAQKRYLELVSTQANKVDPDHFTNIPKL